MSSDTVTLLVEGVIDSYRTWTSGSLLAYEHYIPVRSDLRDLRVRVEWCSEDRARRDFIMDAAHRFAASTVNKSNITKYIGDLLRSTQKESLIYRRRRKIGGRRRIRITSKDKIKKILKNYQQLEWNSTRCDITYERSDGHSIRVRFADTSEKCRKLQREYKVRTKIGNNYSFDSPITSDDCLFFGNMLICENRTCLLNYVTLRSIIGNYSKYNTSDTDRLFNRNTLHNQISSIIDNNITTYKNLNSHNISISDGLAIVADIARFVEIERRRIGFHHGSLTVDSILVHRFDRRRSISSNIDIPVYRIEHLYDSEVYDYRDYDVNCSDLNVRNIDAAFRWTEIRTAVDCTTLLCSLEMCTPTIYGKICASHVGGKDARYRSRLTNRCNAIASMSVRKTKSLPITSKLLNKLYSIYIQNK